MPLVLSRALRRSILDRPVWQAVRETIQTIDVQSRFLRDYEFAQLIIWMSSMLPTFASCSSSHIHAWFSNVFLEFRRYIMSSDVPYKLQDVPVTPARARKKEKSSSDAALKRVVLFRVLPPVRLICNPLHAEQTTTSPGH